MQLATNLSLVHSKNVNVDFLDNVNVRALQFYIDNGMEDIISE